jgi:Putative restriction endonuclease
MSMIQLRIGPADHGRALTLAEFRDAEEEEGYRFELGRGVLEVTEVPSSRHRRVVSNLYRAIGRFDQEHPGLVECFGGGSEFRLWIATLTSGRNPDLGVVLEGTPLDTKGRTQPSLVAEVVSRRSNTRLSDQAGRISRLRHPRILDRRPPASPGDCPGPRGSRLVRADRLGRADDPQCGLARTDLPCRRTVGERLRG